MIIRLVRSDNLTELWMSNDAQVALVLDPKDPKAEENEEKEDNV